MGVGNSPTPISRKVSMQDQNKKQLNAHQFEPVYEKLGINLDKLGCVMLDLEAPEVDIDWQDNLYYAKDKTRKWVDGFVMGETPHITLLYGLLENAHNWKDHIEDVLWDWDLDSVEIESIGSFDSPYKDEPYYCLVGHIKVTPELMEGHSRLELLPHINTFTGYKPHMTIAYIKKDDVLKQTAIEMLTQELVGKKLAVKKNINLGYKPGEQGEKDAK